MEILQRITALLLIVFGGFLLVWSGGKFLVITVGSFEKRYQEHVKRKGAEALFLKDYILQTTEGRRINVTGHNWEALAASLNAPVSSSNIHSRRCGDFDNHFTFHLNEEPFASISTSFKFQYISINDGSNWLTSSMWLMAAIMETMLKVGY